MILDGSNGISGLPVPLPLNQGGTGQTLTASGVVKQGGGVGQLGNQIYIGWTGSLLKATVDVTDLGAIALQNTTIGYGQTWQTFTYNSTGAQRNYGTIYYNTTSKPIQVSHSTNQIMTIVVNGTTIITTSGYNTASPVVQFIVPANGSYSISAAYVAGNTWAELR